VDPKSIGFDAAIEFAPDWRALPQPRFHRQRWDILARVFNRLKKHGIIHPGYWLHNVFLYEEVVERMLAKPAPSYRRFRCATPGWDNSPRRASEATILHGSTPVAYEHWLRCLVEETNRTLQGDERIVFVNAWNEWGEGNHLEPDQRWKRAYLEATARAVTSGNASTSP
jgi:hypothetical protein